MVYGPTTTTNTRLQGASRGNLSQAMARLEPEKKVDLLWLKYDADKSGGLNKQEAKKMFDDFIMIEGQTEQLVDDAFVNFFDELDLNNDGCIQKEEGLRLFEK